MRQRVMIAMALSCEPKLLIADEPTTALDVTIQAQILELLKSIQQRTGSALMLITHDLGVVAEMVDNVIVMYTGQIVEQGTVHEVLLDPRDPYTMGLLESIPSVEKRGGRLSAIKGVVPSPFNLPPACRFAPRCPYAWERCSTVAPGLNRAGGDGHLARCHLHTARGRRPPAGSAGAPSCRVERRANPSGRRALMEAREAHMESAFEHGLAVPQVRGRLRRRLVPSLLRARAILVGMLSIIALIAFTLAVSLVFLRIKGAATSSSRCGRRMRRHRRLHRDEGLQGPQEPGRSRSRWPSASSSPASGAGLVAAVMSVPDADGNKAFAISLLGLIFLGFGMPLTWSLSRSRRWFTELRGTEGPAITTAAFSSRRSRSRTL